MAPPPTAEEQHEQSEAYKASGKKIDDMIAAAGKAPQGGPLEMNFERVIESFYMSALIQMGAIRQDNEPPRVDIIGARQTIDSLGGPAGEDQGQSYRPGKNVAAERAV